MTRYVIMSIAMAAGLVIMPGGAASIVVTAAGIVVAVVMTGLQRELALLLAE